MLILKGENIHLRDWKTEDLETYKYWNQGDQLWMQYDGPYYPKVSPEHLDLFIEKISDWIEKGNWSSPRRRLVISNNSNDEMLGTVSWYWQSQETNWISMGINIFDDKNWSKGIGFEALKLWINYLFDCDKNLVRLDLRTWSGNHGMIKLAQKLGFKQEACFRNARMVKGKYYDSIAMGILREEWESSQSS